MASSGSFRTTSYDGFCLEFSWKQTNQNIANNTTTISWTLKGVSNNTGSYYKTQNITVKIDNKVVFQHLKDKNGQINLWNGTTVASGNHTITHKDDGTQTFSAYAEAGIYAWAVNCTGSGSFTLDTIARASQPSCITWPEHTQNVGQFGDIISIHMNRKSSSMKHTVRYQFGSQTGTCINAETGNATNKDVETGFKWKIPEDLMNLIPNSTSGSGTIYVDTYNGSTKVGTKSCGFTASVPTTVKPSCSFKLEDITGVDDIYGSPVKGLSKIQIDVTPTQTYSSPIKSCTITADGVKYTGTSATTGVLRTAGTSRVTATVTDERGRSGSVSYDMNVQDYTAPVISLLTVKRCDSNGVENDQGECVEVLLSGEVSPMNNKNTATYSVRYKKSSVSEWTELAEDVNGWKPSDLKDNFAVYNYSLVFVADTNSSYDVELVLTDRHNTATRSTSVSTAFTLINWNEDGTGMAIGKVSEGGHKFEIGLDVEFFGKVTGTIFDAIYPVGSIYLAYNHINPGTLFGGTWVRIENTFLWGIDDKGAIGITGGEKTHTLTTNELPAHNHGSVYSQHATGSKNYAWYTASGDKVGYSAIEAGGGQAHNNMPPYIQVSIWRRTA